MTEPIRDIDVVVSLMREALQIKVTDDLDGLRVTTPISQR